MHPYPQKLPARIPEGSGRTSQASAMLLIILNGNCPLLCCIYQPVLYVVGVHIK